MKNDLKIKTISLVEGKNIFKNTKDVNHLKFIYERMINLHGENPDIDYMKKFESIVKWVDENFITP